MSRAVPNRRQPPPAGADPSVVFPPIETWSLDNGLRVDVVRTAPAPDVALRLVTETGAASHPAGQAGLAALSADALAEGAGGRTSPEMARWLDGIGASFAARPSYDATTLSMHAMAEQLEHALEYLAAVTCEPDFDPTEVARRRDMRIDRLRRRRDEPAVVAAEALDEAVFGSHPYGRPLAGTEQTVGALEPDEIAAFWRGGTRPDSARLVIAGSMAPDVVAVAAERAFSRWTADSEASEAGTPGPPPPPAAAGRAGEVLLIDRPAGRQTELRLGRVGIHRGHPDEMNALVMNAILGGVFNSRLNLNLREDKGWTYGARSAFHRRRMPGPFLVRAAVDTAVTQRAVEETLLEMERLREEPPGAEELRQAIDALTLSLPLQFETTGQIAGRRARSIIYGLPDDYWDTYADKMRRVEAGGVLEAARRYLRPEELVIVATGAVEEFAEPLSTVGRVSVIQENELVAP